MRIIHTSDWHLGQYFYSKSRAKEHQAFFDWLLLQIHNYQADAVIVAGDIFDTGSPPSYARELYNRFIVELQSTGCQLIVIAGNHDSVAMLNESSQLLSYLNTNVITYPETDLQKAIIPLYDRQKNLAALLCAVPFIRGRDVLFSQAGMTSEEKQSVIMDAVEDYYQRLYQAADQQRKSLNQNLPIIATGHLTTLGVVQSESERNIYIGTLEAFSANRFPPVDYIALGHIHRPQQVGHAKHIRYSGSPIPLSFDEINTAKSVSLVELDKHGLKEITLLEIPLFQPMALIKGDMPEIEQALNAYRNYPSNNLPVWLDIEIASTEYLADIQRKIELLSQKLPVEVLLLRRSKTERKMMIERLDKETLAELTVDEVFARRLNLNADYIAQEQQQRITTLFQQAVQKVNNGDRQSQELTDENS